MKRLHRLWFGLLVIVLASTGLLVVAPAAQAQQNYWDVHIKNACAYPIRVAVSYKDMNTSQWVNRGWWKVEPGDTKYPFNTRNRYIYFYAETTESVNGQGKLFWKGDGFIDLGDRHYSAIEDRIGMSDHGSYTFTFRCPNSMPPQANLVANRIDQVVRNTQQRLSQPLTASKTTELGNHHHIASTAKLSRNGLLEITTRTWTDNHYSGFHGAVFVKYLDRYGNTIGRSNWTRYGVDCIYCPAPDDRTDYEDYTVPEALLINVYDIEVEHVTDPNTLMESFAQIDGYTRQFLQGSRGIIKTVCDEAPELDREFCTAFAINEVQRNL